MPVALRRLFLPEVLLKLVGRSPRTNVVSGDTSQPEHASHSEISWNGTDLLSGEVAYQQDRVSPVYESIATAADQNVQPEENSHPESGTSGPHILLSGSATTAQCTDSNQPPSMHAVNILPARGHHRRTSSATSDISLNSTVSTTGAYTGFTQSGKYDLTLDVILRGEFISEQQSKAWLLLSLLSSSQGTYSTNPDSSNGLLHAGCHRLHSLCYLHRYYNFDSGTELQDRKGMAASFLKHIRWPSCIVNCDLHATD